MRPAAQPASARASRHRRRQASHPPHSHPHATRDKSPRRPCLRRGRCARSECAAPPRRRGRGRRGSCPTHDAMLMTFAGRCCAARRSISCSACVRKNGAFRFRSTALSQPASGNSSNAAAQAAPALFTRISSWLSRSASAAARHWAPASLRRSAAIAERLLRHVSVGLRAAAVVSCHGPAPAGAARSQGRPVESEPGSSLTPPHFARHTKRRRGVKDCFRPKAVRPRNFSRPASW